MRLKNIGLILLLALSKPLFAQTHKFLSPPSFNEADLKKKHSLIEESAPAEILYNSMRYSISPEFKVEKEYISKIKIYDKKNAEKWLNIEFPVKTQEFLDKFEVNVYNLKDNKVEKLSIDKREQLKENFVKGVKIYKLAIPNILDGSVIEYRYKITTSDIFSLSYYLEYDIPVVYEEYNLEYPDAINYLFNTTGNPLKTDYNISTAEDHNGTLYNIFRFGYDNLKPIKNELFVKDLARYRSRIKPEFRGFITNRASYYEPESWSKLAQQLNNNDDFGGFLKNDGKGILPDDIKNFYDLNERANKIFNFVKTNYRWNKDEGFIASQNLRQLIKTKAGNSADINLLLIMLLRYAGIEANPLLISTLDNGILNITTPSYKNLNFVIASVKINNQIYFYDATSFNSKVNILPERDWNDFGILIDKNKADHISFSNTNISKKEFVIKAVLDIQNSAVKGTFSEKESGLYAIEAYDNFDINKDKYNQEFKTKYNADIKEVESKVAENGDFESQMKFTGSNLMDVVGSKLVINPLLFLNGNNETFNQTEERIFSIDFISAFKHEKNVELEIPEGYQILNLPKPKVISTDDKEINYTYSAQIVGNKLLVKSIVDVASQSYPKEYYPFFKQIWKIISDSESQVISIVKK